MKVIIKTANKTYRWKAPSWLKAAALCALGLATMLVLFNVYATAVGHPLWG